MLGRKKKEKENAEVSLLVAGFYLTVEIYETGQFYDYFLMLINERGEKEKQLHNGKEASAGISLSSSTTFRLRWTPLPRALGTTSGSQRDETF